MFGIEKFLTEHSLAAQAATAIFGAALTFVLVVTTIAYLVEAHKTRKAAELQAAAAQESLTTAQESLLLLKQEYEDRIGEGPQIVKHAIKAALESISAWIGQVLLGVHEPGRVADPSDLIPPELTSAMGHARRISPSCAEQIGSAIGQMRLAKTHIQTLRQSALHGPSRIAGQRSPIADILERAREHLKSAEKDLSDATQKK